MRVQTKRLCICYTGDLSTDIDTRIKDTFGEKVHHFNSSTREDKTWVGITFNKIVNITTENTLKKISHNLVEYKTALTDKILLSYVNGEDTAPPVVIKRPREYITNDQWEDIMDKRRPPINKEKTNYRTKAWRQKLRVNLHQYEDELSEEEFKWHSNKNWEEQNAGYYLHQISKDDGFADWLDKQIEKDEDDGYSEYLKQQIEDFAKNKEKIKEMDKKIKEIILKKINKDN